MKTAEEIVRTKVRKWETVSQDTTILEALKLMAVDKLGSIFIKESGKIIGVWTERNFLRDSISESFDIKTSKIGDYMTKKLITAPHDASIYKLMDIYLKEYVRRILIEKEGEIIGMVYIFDVMEEVMEEKNNQLKELNKLMNLEYYKRDYKPKRR